MKNNFTLSIIALLLITVCSCSKKSIETRLLAGNWSVVNDSSLNTGAFFLKWVADSGISSSNYINDSNYLGEHSNYIGEQCGATFNFNSNGNMVTSFYNCTYGWPIVDSSKYLLTGNQITISIFAQKANCCSFTYFNPIITRTYTISNLTVNTSTLTFFLPTGVASDPRTEIINLKK